VRNYNDSFLKGGYDKALQLFEVFLKKKSEGEECKEISEIRAIQQWIRLVDVQQAALHRLNLKSFEHRFCNLLSTVSLQLTRFSKNKFSSEKEEIKRKRPNSSYKNNYFY
jgi:hypothetical protein